MKINNTTQDMQTNPKIYLFLDLKLIYSKHIDNMAAIASKTISMLKVPLPPNSPDTKRYYSIEYDPIILEYKAQHYTYTGCIQ